MSIENKFEPIDYNKLLLDKINSIYKTLGSECVQEMLGDKIEGCETLRGKRIVMVDDMAGVLEGFVNDLMVATDGNANFILHKDQTIGVLVKQILDENPDIVLMDKNLANRVDGTDVIKTILHHMPGATCIGFSSESNSGKEFVSAGAKGFVSKNLYDPRTIQNIAKLIKE